MDIINKWKSFIFEKWKILVGVFLFLTLTIVFLIQGSYFQKEEGEDTSSSDIYEELIAEQKIEDEATKEMKAADKSGSEEIDEQEPREIVVDVKGAVKTPGVYQMKPNSRIVDAIEKAGGLIETAEQNAVNLAQIVEDQMVIYVPEIGEEGVDIILENVTTVSENTTQNKESNLININNAEKSELMLLNGIGESKADNIITYRNEKGLFKSIEEIKNVSGIGEATFEKIKESITVSR